MNSISFNTHRQTRSERHGIGGVLHDRQAAVCRERCHESRRVAADGNAHAAGVGGRYRPVGGGHPGGEGGFIVE